MLIKNTDFGNLWVACLRKDAKPAMVCTANDLSAWKDFPKGLRVLLLDEDANSAAEIKSKLEAMDYIVTVFCDENEALSALSEQPESFHVAIVEVSINHSNGSFKFLENAKDLPTIMTSNIHCLNAMMKCIAHGAVEFLPKPLSEDKLRNIWQHVVHKAFNGSGKVLPESLKPVKDSVTSMLLMEVETKEPKNENSDRIKNESPAVENDHVQSPGSDKYPAPSTPQLNQGARLLDDGDCQDHTTFSTERDSGEQGESKSVETTCTMTEETLQVDHPQSLSKTIIVKQEDDSADGVKNDNIASSYPRKDETVASSHPRKDDERLKNPDGNAENPIKATGLHNSCGTRVNRKKIKVDWTPELHKKFVHAVEQLGVDQAIPSRILEVMKVEGLNRHNVASHLQKYRMHRRHILPKEDDRRWQMQRDQIHRSYYPHKPIMAYPPYHSNHTFPLSPAYPVWGAPGAHPTGVQMWGSPGYAPWPPADSWHWKPYTAMHADAWGCPVMPQPHTPYSSSPQAATGFHSSQTVNNGSITSQNSYELHPAIIHPTEEVIDNVVKEAINKPWLPLPLGLKPPSAEIVLAELSRQGISRIPPQNQRL